MYLGSSLVLPPLSLLPLGLGLSRQGSSGAESRIRGAMPPRPMSRVDDEPPAAKKSDASLWKLPKFKEVSSALSALVVKTLNGQPIDPRNPPHNGAAEGEMMNGVRYKAEMVEGRMHGPVELSWKDGLVYIGEMNLNEITGNGEYNYPDGSVYVGAVMKGLRHGVGTFTSGDGNVKYEGQWQRGQKQGQGRITYGPPKGSPDGVVSYYAGSFLCDNKDGIGKMVYASGNEYEGEWRKNLKQGQGIMAWKDMQEEYVGEWKEGFPHGEGAYTWRRYDPKKMIGPSRYVGQFERGARAGQGRMIYSHGLSYDGGWARDKKEGQGTLTVSNAQTEAIFHNGSMYIRAQSAQITGLPEEKKVPIVDQVSKLNRVETDLSVRNAMPCAKEACVGKVNNLLKVHHYFLVSLYVHYASLGFTSDPEEIDDSYTMDTHEFLRLVQDMGVPSKV